MTLLNKFLTIGVVLVFILSFIFGCEFGKSRVRCKEITTETITHVDTVIHEIKTTKDHYIDRLVTVIKHDTILVKADTNEILADYFNLHVYERSWGDDTLSVTMNDTISMNRSIGNDFHYKINVPFTTINNNVDNSIHYAKYFSIGVSIPVNNIKYSELYGIYHFPKGFLGAGYSSELKSPMIHVGATIFKFK